MLNAPIIQRGCKVFNLILDTSYLIGEVGESFYVNLFIVVFELIHATSSIWILNVVTSTFIYRCEQFAALPNNGVMIEESKQIVDQYGNLQKGLGPTLLFQISSNLLNITGYFYWFTIDYDWKYCPAIAYGIIIIWNLNHSYSNFQQSKFQKAIKILK